MKFENTQVWGFEHALRGMRNPKNSWDKSDSWFGKCYLNDCNDTMTKFLIHTTGEDAEDKHHYLTYNGFFNWQKNVGCVDENKKFADWDNWCEYALIGEKDMELAQKLIKSGSEHRKFMRQIFVSVDITAPMYWWSEADTYKVGTVANSTSKMHKLASTPITLDCFETDDCDYGIMPSEINSFINSLEELRQQYLKTKDKRYWKELIRWLPESWLQTRTVTMSYENLLAMCGKGQRRFHKLNEWSGIDDAELPNFISWARSLPYADKLIFVDEQEGEK